MKSSFCWHKSEMCPSEQFDGVFFDLFTFSWNFFLKNVKKRVMGVWAVHCSGDGPSEVEPFGSRFPKHLLEAPPAPWKKYKIFSNKLVVLQFPEYSFNVGREGGFALGFLLQYLRNKFPRIFLLRQSQAFFDRDFKEFSTIQHFYIGCRCMRKCGTEYAFIASASSSDCNK